MIGLLLVYAIGTCVLVSLVWEMHSEAVSSGEKVLTAFSLLTEEQTTRTIENVEQTLEIAQERLDSAKHEDTPSGPQDPQGNCRSSARRKPAST